MRVLKSLAFLVAWMFVTGCAKTIPQTRFPKTIIPSENKHVLHVNTSNDPLEVLYLGCGHLIMQYKGENIMLDPFFSTHKLLDGSLQSDSGAFKKYKTTLASHNIDMKQIKSVWLAHKHYDHVLDLPKLLEENLILPAATIYGSNLGDTILYNFLSERNYNTLTRAETYQPGENAIPEFQSAAKDIRILPIRSNHAPHFKLLGIPIHLMKGNIKAGYFRNFRSADQITKRKQWKEGCTYAYLIDFMEGQKIGYRLYVQTSASHYPMGKPPMTLLKERGVDAAFLCVASSNYVKRKYPKRILTDLNPKKIVWIHWEDFFGSALEFKDARPVRLTNFRGLARRLRKAGFPATPDNHVMPRPGTMITVH